MNGSATSRGDKPGWVRNTSPVGSARKPVGLRHFRDVVVAATAQPSIRAQRQRACQLACAVGPSRL